MASHHRERVPVLPTYDRDVNALRVSSTLSRLIASKEPRLKDL